MTVIRRAAQKGQEDEEAGDRGYCRTVLVLESMQVSCVPIARASTLLTIKGCSDSFGTEVSIASSSPRQGEEAPDERPK